MESNANGSNFVKYMSNPRSFTLKKWFIEILQEDYAPHDTIIERMSTSLTTENDLQEFGKLITCLYEKAYKKAVDDYCKQAEELGIKVSIIAEESKKSLG